MRMSRSGKFIIYVQILVTVCLALCTTSIINNCPKKPGAFPCKEHVCGCKSETDCMTHCCCFPAGDSQGIHNNAKEDKSGLLSFISSLQCKSGSDAVSFINSNLKYIVEVNTISHQLVFLCFLSNVPFIHPCEPIVSPPEKPPRYFLS